VQVDHGDAGAAAVERAEPRRRTLRIETGPLSMVLGALQRSKLRLGDRERGRRRGAALLAGLDLPLRFGCPTRKLCAALPLAWQRGGLNVDGDESSPRIGDDLSDKSRRRHRVGGVGRPHPEVREH
jgi:hypothetical protein